MRAKGPLRMRCKDGKELDKGKCVSIVFLSDLILLLRKFCKDGRKEMVEGNVRNTSTSITSPSMVT